MMANSSSMKRRRGKRDKHPHSDLNFERPKRKSRAAQRHANDAPRGGIEALLPSVIFLVVLACGVMAKMGFRGRASVAGIDLGTTNSVICVQKLEKGLGEIECIADPASGSPIVSSTVSFLEPWERKVGPSSKLPSDLRPHPSHVVVGDAAKKRIDTHPHHTLYQAKRVLGRPQGDPAIEELRKEVEFGITEDDGGVVFSVPDTPLPITPQQVGSYVVHHLIQITKAYLGHDNVKSAVICVPAKFDDEQRRITAEAFKAAGISVARIVEEPTSAALAYGLHRKEGVDYILVYDFGGGTLDISMLHVSDGFVDVMGSDGDDRLGGADFDAAVAHFLLEEKDGDNAVKEVALELERLQDAHPQADLEELLASKCPRLKVTPLCTFSSLHTMGEQMKIQVSQESDPEANVSASCLVPSSAMDSQILSADAFCNSLVERQFDITPSQFDRVAQSLLARSVLPVQRILSELGLSTTEIHEVVMVGGTTRMPQIRWLVQEALPHSQVNTHIDPDITVAYGAASVMD